MQGKSSNAGTGLSRDEARALTETILGLSTADNARVSLASGRRRFIRSADNRTTTAGGSADVSVTILSVFGKRVASVTTNLLDEAALKAAVERSESLAQLAPEDPEYLSELEQQSYGSFCRRRLHERAITVAAVRTTAAVQEIFAIRCSLDRPGFCAAPFVEAHHIILDARHVGDAVIDTL